MGTVRVSPSKAVRLAKVHLTDVDEKHRLLVSRRMREKRWDDELRPDIGYSPDTDTRMRALYDAILIEGAARNPSGRAYLVPETAIEDVLAKHGTTP